MEIPGITLSVFTEELQTYRAVLMRLAFPNATGELFELDRKTIVLGLDASRKSPRKRMIFPIHRNQDDLVQRMLNFFQPGTYVIPHRHSRDAASETMFVMQGKIGFLLLDETGGVRQSVIAEAGGLIDIVPNVWHSLVALEPDTVILEVKRGPYDETDKDFAPWAPGEGTAEAESLRQTYEAYFAN